MRDEIKSVLRKYQEGYSKRDLHGVETFVNELFVNEPDTFIVGTGNGEWCKGLQDIRELIQIDWEYWGDLVMDVENAHISIHDNSVACVAMEAVLNKKTESEKLYKNCLERVNQIREMDSCPKDTLVHILKTVSGYLYEENLSEKISRPIRITAVLVKKEKWRFQNIHFSYPVSPPTDYRIINDKIDY